LSLDDFDNELRQKYFKVIKIRTLFPIPLTSLPPTGYIPPAILSQLSRPVLELKLENGTVFRMGGIPQSIALEIWEVLEKRRNFNEDFDIDPRFSLSQVVNEIAEVKRVRIEDVLEKYNVYVAEVDLVPEGFGKPLTLKMIPSHAILLGLRAKAEIYVRSELVEDDGRDYEREEDEGQFYDI